MREFEGGTMWNGEQFAVTVIGTNLAGDMVGEDIPPMSSGTIRFGTLYSVVAQPDLGHAATGSGATRLAVPTEKSTSATASVTDTQ